MSTDEPWRTGHDAASVFTREMIEAATVRVAPGRALIRGELYDVRETALGYEWAPMTVTKALRVAAWGDRPRRHGWHPAKPRGWRP